MLDRDDEDRATHTAFNVYPEMLRQVCRDYATLPPLRTMSIEEVIFFYDGLRPELKRATKPK